MVGSLKYFEYESDDGFKYAVHLDESNSEIAALGLTSPISAETRDSKRRIAVSSQTPIQPRYVNATTQINGEVVKKRFWVGKPDADAWTDTEFFEGVQRWSITSHVGEVRLGIPAVDTGQTDGDEDANLPAAP